MSGWLPSAIVNCCYTLRLVSNVRRVLRAQMMMCESIVPNLGSDEVVESAKVEICLAVRKSRSRLAYVPLVITAAAILWLVATPFLASTFTPSDRREANSTSTKSLKSNDSIAIAKPNLSAGTSNAPYFVIAKGASDSGPNDSLLPVETANEISRVVLRINQFNYESGQIPAVAPLENSVNVAFRLIRKPFTKEKALPSKKKQHTTGLSNHLLNRFA